MLSSPLYITYETEVQLASIYTRIIPPNSSYLTVELQAIQQQEGVHDCGLFAVANAVEVCIGGKNYVNIIVVY